MEYGFGLYSVPSTPEKGRAYVYDGTPIVVLNTDEQEVVMAYSDDAWQSAVAVSPEHFKRFSRRLPDYLPPQLLRLIEPQMTLGFNDPQVERSVPSDQANENL